MTLQELEKYIGGKKRHKGYAKTVYLYDQMRVPAEGEYPFFSIDERRNLESVNTKVFRQLIWVEISKETISQIQTCISKIRRSSDWSVEFPKELPSFIPKDESLRTYTEKKFPFYTTFESWTFSVLLKNYLIATNGLVIVKPIRTDLKDNEYSEPYPTIYNPREVIDYKEGEYAVVEIIHYPETVEYFNGQIIEQMPVPGTEKKSYIHIDKQEITYYDQTEKGLIKNVEKSYVHGLGVFPGFLIRGRFFKDYDGYTVNESPIQTVGARLKEFDREYSDLQAAVYQHMFPEKWQWATQLCLTCSKSGISTGRIWVDDKGRPTNKATKKEVVCPQCHGMGQVAASPYQNLVIRPSKPNVGEQPAPIPPAGYITKPIDIIKLQAERCNEHAYKALCSINMQFLMQVPQNQSGYAKDVDREELNNFAYGCAEDIVWMMDKLYYLYAKYRYRQKSDGQVMKDEEINKLLPKVAVPQKFDLLSSNYLIDELERAQRANLNPLILAQLNVEYGVKHFYQEPEMRDLLKVVMNLDPLAGLNEDSKMLRLQNEGITTEDYIISSNILPFVMRAKEENENFLMMALSEQAKILKKYAIEKKREIEQSKPEEQPVREDIVLNGVN